MIIRLQIVFSINKRPLTGAVLLLQEKSLCWTRFEPRRQGFSWLSSVFCRHKLKSDRGGRSLVEEASGNSRLKSVVAEEGADGVGGDNNRTAAGRASGRRGKVQIDDAQQLSRGFQEHAATAHAATERRLDQEALRMVAVDIETWAGYGP